MFYGTTWSSRRTVQRQAVLLPAHDPICVTQRWASARGSLPPQRDGEARSLAGSFPPHRLDAGGEELMPAPRLPTPVAVPSDAAVAGADANSGEV